MDARGKDHGYANRQKKTGKRKGEINDHGYEGIEPPSIIAGNESKKKAY
jgi:hypothetical protein